MALTIEQLHKLLHVLNVATYEDIYDDRASGRLEDVVVEEINRLTNGPYTLAEAVASGRPFRRKGEICWALWEHEDAPGRYHYAGRGLSYEHNTSEDILACDYELIPLDEQET